MDELIKALRYCMDEDKICTEQTNCGYYGKGFFCQDVLLRAAADAIERLQAENDELRAEKDTYRKLLLLSDGEINELRYKLHLDNMEIDTVPSIEDLKVPSGKENAR